MQLQNSVRERLGVLAGDVSRSKKPAGCPLASASREWADGFAACKRAAAEADFLPTDQRANLKQTETTARWTADLSQRARSPLSLDANAHRARANRARFNSLRPRTRRVP